MHWFLKLLIYPLLEALGPSVIVEVGVEVGAVTGPLLRWAESADAVLHAIDPDPTLNVERLLEEHGARLRFHRVKSLEVLGEIAAVDLALIDGDHNWYTVINELRALERRALGDGREPPVILLHDVGWPYGRRDLYYDPPSIPEAHRHPHARGGLKPGRVELGPGYNDHLENAQLEGTPANGVLSAVEDFVAESTTLWQKWSIPGLSGMAILVSTPVLERCAPLAELLDSLDRPAFLRAHCEAVEQARIDSDLKRANIQRRLAETQLKQVLRSVDPRELVELRKHNRELTERVEDLEREVARVAELEEQVRVLSRPAAEEPDRQPEREAWQTLLDLYVPLLDGAPPTEDERDPLSLPSPLDLRGVLCDAESEQEPGAPSVDVVICVHDALEDVRLCLCSLLEKTERRLRLIVVDDGSEQATTRFLRAFADRHPAVTLIHRERPPHGYTLAANVGLEASSADYVVLLNSDTILTPGWLSAIVSHGEARPAIGILGPLSNAASHQSIPAIRENGAWATNPLPDWLTVDAMSLAVSRAAPHLDVALPFINGFCFAIKRSVIERVGLLDDELFQTGYCEENDYCQRAREAGFELAVVDAAYVHHAKSRSFGTAGRTELATRNYGAFLEKHGRGEIEALVSELEADRGLQPMREAVTQATSSPEAFAPLLSSDGRDPLSVVFLLPGLAHGGSGGSHSVYQEARALRRLGVPARIMLPHWDRGRAAATYEDAEELFETWSSEEELLAKTADADVISATHHKSVALLEAIRAQRSDFLAAYYVQDYEPFFTAPHLAAEAVASYTALPDMLLFAKSHWLCNVVAERHGLFVAKVEPSIDRELFDTKAPQREQHERQPLRIVAMVRPRTARRQPLATVATLERLLETHRGQVRVSTFGCYANELREILPGEHPIHEHHLGLLSRSAVAELLRESDVFLDMSVYQAFGRTALEAMACGCTAVVPGVGGVWEFLEHGRNGLAVDTLELEDAVAALDALVDDRELLRRLKLGARETATRYSSVRAALSEYLLFERAHRARFGDVLDGLRPSELAAHTR